MRFAIIIFALVLSCSCKKNRMCTCNTLVNYPGGSENFTSGPKPLEKRLTTKQAETICKREASAVDKTYSNGFTNNGNLPANGVYSRTTCDLK